ncbi:MAG: Dps family protein [Streptococcus sp.]|nr:Dps family protein [Streptococcus sp.]
MTKQKNDAAKDVATFSKLNSLSSSLPKTKAILNQVVADLYTAHIAIHQVHWYMRGQGFMVWHPKMDEYMEALDEILDQVSERLIMIGGTPYSTLTEFIQHSNIEEKAGRFTNDVSESLERVVEIFRYLANLYQEALDITDEEGDDVSNDIFVGAKNDVEKNIWMLTAELGQSPEL